MIVNGITIAECWEQSIRLLLTEGSFIPTERGLPALEMINLMLRVEEPLREPRAHPKYPFAGSFLSQYEYSLLKPSQNYVSVFDRLYAFGDGKCNQVDEVVSMLRKEAATRRAILTTWYPPQDMKSENPPCIISIQCMIRNDRLTMLVVMRSNDAWLGAPCDMLALTRLQEYIASHLGISPGSYTQLSASYHLYELDVIEATSLFGEK